MHPGSAKALQMTFFHGSMIRLEVGTILLPQEKYAESWGSTSFCDALEHHRPADMIAHKDAVFMCQSDEDVDLAGGGTEWLFEVEPVGKIQRHDLNWSSEISCLTSDGHAIDSDEVKRAAEAYWSGLAHHDENVWEYLAVAARIISVTPFDDSPEAPEI